jgi:hypothetical protein
MIRRERRELKKDVIYINEEVGEWKRYEIVTYKLTENIMKGIQIQKQERITREMPSKRRVKQLIKKVGRSKSIDKFESARKCDVEMSGKSWTIGVKSKFKGSEHVSKLDSTEFREEAEFKCKIPKENCRLPYYAMKIFDLTGCMFKKRVETNMAIAMITYVYMDWMIENKNPQTIVDDLAMILRAKYKKEHRKDRKKWENVCDKMSSSDYENWRSRGDLIFTSLTFEERGYREMRQACKEWCLEEKQINGFRSDVSRFLRKTVMEDALRKNSKKMSGEEQCSEL